MRDEKSGIFLNNNHRAVFLVFRRQKRISRISIKLLGMDAGSWQEAGTCYELRRKDDGSLVDHQR